MRKPGSPDGEHLELPFGAAILDGGSKKVAGVVFSCWNGVFSRQIQDVYVRVLMKNAEGVLEELFGEPNWNQHGGGREELLPGKSA